MYLVMCAQHILNISVMFASFCSCLSGLVFAALPSNFLWLDHPLEYPLWILSPQITSKEACSVPLSSHNEFSNKLAVCTFGTFFVLTCKRVLLWIWRMCLVYLKSRSFERGLLLVLSIHVMVNLHGKRCCMSLTWPLTSRLRFRFLWSFLLVPMGTSSVSQNWLACVSWNH